MRLLFAAMALMVAADQASSQTLSEQVEVRVANIDVVVTDRTGKRVTGLTRDDFELFENGQKKEISNFYESVSENIRPEVVAAGPTPAETAPGATPRPRRILVLIDNHSLDTDRRSEVLQSLENFLNRTKRADDQVAIVAWNRSAKIVTPFTTSNDQLKQGIASMRQSIRSGVSFPQELERVRALCQREYDQAESGFGRSYQEAFQSCAGSIQAFAEEAAFSNRLLLDGLRTTVAQFAGLDGKKALVFAGAHLPVAPGEELAIWAYRLFQPKLRNLSAAAIIDSPRTSVQFKLDDVANQATTSDVSLYFIDAAEQGDSSRSVEQQTSSSTSALETSIAANNTADAFRALADVTGGAVVGRSTHFDVAFNTVAADISTYYSLGFKPAQNDGPRRVSVKMKNREYTARARTAYAPKTLDAEVTERLLTNLVHGTVRGDWAIRVETGGPQADGKYFRVPMKISIPSSITLLPEGDQLAGGYTVYVVMSNAAGGMSKVMKTQQAVRLPASAETDLRSKPLTFEGTLVMRPGDNTLSVAIVDQLSNVAGYATTRISAR